MRLYDARLLDRESFGEFDAVASLGAFEHFCSVEEYRDGRQEEIYRGREKIAREHTHMWSIADAATQFAAMADRPSTVTIRVESVSVPQGNDRQTGQRQGAANAYGAHALHIVHLPGNSGGNTMSETDLKQGTGANGASGQDEQISEAQGEGRSTEVPPYEPAAVDRAASRRRARIIAGGTVVAAGALAFIQIGRAHV